MKTHENRALFSRALLKATTCLFLTAGIGISAAYAVPEASTSVMETVQQNQTISGRITDTSGEPVIGASVVVKGTTNGTITDFDGKFSLNAPAQGTLTISYIGYKKMEISINGQRTVNVTLKEDTEILDEVVVVGYGTQNHPTPHRLLPLPLFPVRFQQTPELLFRHGGTDNFRIRYFVTEYLFRSF